MPSDKFKRRYMTDTEWKALNPLLGGGVVGRERLEVQPTDFISRGEPGTLGSLDPLDPDVLMISSHPERLYLGPQEGGITHTRRAVGIPTYAHETAHSLQYKVPIEYHQSRRELPERFTGRSPYYYGGPGGLETAHREGLRMKDFHSEQQAAIIEDFFHDLSTARKQGYSTRAAKRLPAAGAYMQQLKTAVITKQTQGLKAKMTKSPIQWWSDWLKRSFK